MASVKQPPRQCAPREQSSYNDYIATLEKIAPQLRSLLGQLNNEQAVRAGAPKGECAGGGIAFDASSRRGTGSTKTRKSAASRARPSSGARASSSAAKTRRSGAPPRRAESGLRAAEETVQAVSNCGKIVYGVVRDGKLEVQGTVGEVAEDLLGVDCVNAGRKASSKRTGGGSRAKSSSSSSAKRSAARRTGVYGSSEAGDAEEGMI